MVVLDRRMQKAAALLAFLWVALIVYLSLTPQHSTVVSFPGVDKIGHLAFYGILGLLCALALPDKLRRSGLGIVAVVLVVTAFGGVVEFFQAVFTNRQAMGWDLLANSVGALLSAVAASRLRLNRA